MVQKPTPEEQLLKLIEGGEAGKAAAEGSKPQKTGEAPVSTQPLSNLKKIPGFMAYFKTNFFGKSAKWDRAAILDIRNINRSLAGLVAVSVLYLIVDLFLFKPGDPHFLAQVGTSDAVFPITSGALGTTATELNIYKGTLQKRNPFLPPQSHGGPVAADSGGEGLVSSSQGTLNEMLQGFKLVGISVSDQPLAMIEEASTGRTYFLRKGQEFKGMKIQDVSQEKVTLTYEGQEADLF